MILLWRNRTARKLSKAGFYELLLMFQKLKIKYIENYSRSIYVIQRFYGVTIDW